MIARSVIRFFNTGGMLKDSSTLFVGMATVHVCNLFFQVVMGRCLAPEEYALLIALIGMFNILFVPMGVVSTTVSRYASLLVQEERRGDVGRLILYWLRIMLIPGGCLALGCFLFPDTLAGFLHLERSAPLIIFGIVVMGAFIRPVLDGALLGLQCFKGWSLSSALGWGTRLIVGTLLVLLVSPYAGWGLLGHGLGFYVAIGIGALVLAVQLKGHARSDRALPRMQGYVFASFFILMGFSCLMTADVVLVKHLHPEASGDFSYAATLGRLVIFIPQALVASMFPKVVAEGKGSRLQWQIFLRTCLMTLLCTVASAAVFWFVAKYALLLIYGISEPSGDLLAWCRTLAWIMVPVSMLSVTARFALAQRMFWAVSVLPLAAICYIALAFRSESVEGLLTVLAACSLGALLVCGLLLAVRLAHRAGGDED